MISTAIVEPASTFVTPSLSGASMFAEATFASLSRSGAVLVGTSSAPSTTPSANSDTPFAYLPVPSSRSSSPSARSEVPVAASETPSVYSPTPLLYWLSPSLNCPAPSESSDEPSATFPTPSDRAGMPSASCWLPSATPAAPSRRPFEALSSFGAFFVMSSMPFVIFSMPSSRPLTNFDMPSLSSDAPSDRSSAPPLSEEPFFSVSRPSTARVLPPAVLRRATAGFRCAVGQVIGAADQRAAVLLLLAAVDGLVESARGAVQQPLGIGLLDALAHLVGSARRAHLGSCLVSLILGHDAGVDESVEVGVRSGQLIGLVRALFEAVAVLVQSVGET